MTYVPMPEHLKEKLGDTEHLRTYFTKKLVYFPIKTHMSASQQAACLREFLPACRRYMEYYRTTQ